MKRILALALVLVMFLSLAACGGTTGSTGSDTSGDTPAETPDTAPEDTTYTIRIGHSDTDTNLIHVCLEKFKTAVEEQTDGRVTIEIFPSEELGSNAEMAKMVEMGNLEAMMMPSGQESAYAPKMLALGLPFLFSDYEHVYKVLDSDLGAEMVEDLAKQNLIQIAWWENGLRQITNSIRPIETPQDLGGLMIRIPDDQMTKATFKAFGARPAFLGFSELYDALAEKEFDGQENPIANIYANNFQEVQDYLTIMNYQYQPKNMIFNLEYWNALPSDLQEIITECAVTYGLEHRKAVADSESEMLAELESSGMQVSYPDPAPFIEATQSIYDDFYAQYSWAKELVADISALK